MVALQVAEQMCDYLLNGSVVNAINMPSVSAEDAPKLRPYMLLGELLGSISGQVCNSGFKSITIEYEGQASELNTRPITACVLKGLLSPMMDSVNMVNASVVARERNIAVSVVNHERDCEYQTLVSLGSRRRPVIFRYLEPFSVAISRELWISMGSPWRRR